jgi:hypothetical protein
VGNTGDTQPIETLKESESADEDQKSSIKDQLVSVIRDAETRAAENKRSESAERIRSDDLGHSVWKYNIPTEKPDPCAETLDLVKSLENDELELEDAEPAGDAGADPYNRSKRDR